MLVKFGSNLGKNFSKISLSSPCGRNKLINYAVAVAFSDIMPILKIHKQPLFIKN